MEIASRSRGTPRLANNRLRWVRDYAISKANGKITLAVAHDALDMQVRWEAEQKLRLWHAREGLHYFTRAIRFLPNSLGWRWLSCRYQRSKVWPETTSCGTCWS